jgi:LysR family transcriptional regulator, regulator for genes of the gallate degradation pathway
MSRPALPRVSFRALRQMVAVQETGSLSRAAESLHVSVSSLSRAVNLLEREWQTPLLERGARGTALTTAANVFVRCGRQVHGCLCEWVQKAHAPSTAQLVWQGKVDLVWRRSSETQFACLAAVAEAGSESMAAHRLGLSQPAVHQKLRALDDMLGVPLVQRAGMGVRMTEAGQRAMRSAKLILQALRLAEDELAHLLGHGQRQVVVGVLPMASTGLVPQALNQVWRIDPGLRVTLVDGVYDALLERLRQGDLDLLIGPLRGERAPSDVREHVLFNEHLMVVVGRCHLLAPRTETQALPALLDQLWIAPLPNTPARTAFERMFADAGLVLPGLAAEANSPAILRALLAQGRHMALVSPLQIDAELRSGEIVAFPVNVQLPSRQVGVAVRRGGELPQGGMRLLAALQELAQAGSL